MFKIININILKRFKCYFAVFFKHVFLYKKKEGHFKYAIITFVSNSNYIERFVKSVINQRLDFEKNIFLIFINNSNSIKSKKNINLINMYKNKYPNNITYIENDNIEDGYSLKGIIENYSNVSWVSFVNLNNFLDINYFYNIDNILNKNINTKLLMSNYICNGEYVFYDKTKINKDEFYRLNIDFYLDIFVFNADIIKNNTHFNITPFYKLSEVYFLENYMNIIKSDNILLVNSFISIDGNHNNCFDYYYYGNFNNNIKIFLQYLYSNYIVIPDFIQKAMLYDINIFMYCIEKKIVSSMFCVIEFLDEYFSFISNINLIKRFKYFIKEYYKEIIIYFKQVRNNFKYVKYKINENGLLYVYYYTYNSGDVEEFFVNKNELFPTREDVEELFFLENIKIYKKTFILNIKKIYFTLFVNINGETSFCRKFFNFKSIFYNNEELNIDDVRKKAIKAQNKLLLDAAIKKWKIIVEKKDSLDENVASYIRCLRLMYRYDEIENFLKTMIYNDTIKHSDCLILELIKYAIESKQINLAKFLLKKYYNGNNLLFLEVKARLNNILFNKNEINKILKDMNGLIK
ncbi:hypothetical protein HDK04_000919 [Campylobacter jejuni]|nr:hypothetical protein [Campylobacter jejuni]